MTPKLLILDNSLDPSVYTPVLHWSSFADLPMKVVRAETEMPSELASFTHAFVTGSEASIVANDPWIGRQCTIVRELARHRIPTLASCFGHQMLAKALWGPGFVRRSPTPEFGWVEVALTSEGLDDPLLQGVDTTFHTFSAHFDEIAPLPPDFLILGRSSRCPHAIVRVAGLPMWGIQHHPEINVKQGLELLEAILFLMPDRRALIQSSSQTTPRDSEQVTRLVQNFLVV